MVHTFASLHSQWDSRARFDPRVSSLRDAHRKKNREREEEGRPRKSRKRNNVQSAEMNEERTCKVGGIGEWGKSSVLGFLSDEKGIKDDSQM